MTGRDGFGAVRLGIRDESRPEGQVKTNVPILVALTHGGAAVSTRRW